MTDKEAQKPQLVLPPIPTGSIYEQRRPLSPGTKGPLPDGADPAAATAAATAAAVSVEPGLQEAILKLLPKWKPLVERVDKLEERAQEAVPQLSQEFLDDFAELKEVIEARVEEDNDRLTAMGERLNALTSVVSELREDLGAEEVEGAEEPGAEKGE